MQNDNGNVSVSPSLTYIGAASFPLIGAMNLEVPSGSLHLDAPISNTTKFYLSVYGYIIGANLFFTIFRSVLFALAGLRAAAVLHENMLDAVLQVCLLFLSIFLC